MQAGQQVNHWQHGSGVIVEFINLDVIHVRFEDSRVRMLCAENLTDLSNRPLIRPASTIDAVAESIKRAKRLLISRRALLEEGIAPQVDYPTFVNHLLNTEDYQMTLDATEEGLETAQAEYISWTGSSFPEELIRIDQNRTQPRRWKFKFRDVQIDGRFRSYPFPVIMMGSQDKPFARLCDGTCRGLYQAGWIHMHYACEVEKLVRLGLRGRE